jgi:nicotinate-nucleotide--dimethylbenzimidazole phosphoribosyltransferase
MSATEQWFQRPAAAIDEGVRERALQRQAQLTKPPGSLGRLEQCAVQLAALQGREAPALEQVLITIFAGDHGVAAEGVSAFPQAVTAEMVRNFAAGGAAITVLARQQNARFQVVNVGTVAPLEPLTQVIDRRIGPGTANLRHEPAMSEQQCLEALAAGREVIDAACPLDLFIGGEMGIANTTTATALACALLPAPPVTLVGRGTGLDASGMEHKTVVIEQALKKHAGLLHEPLSALAAVGGFELAALAGAYLRAAQCGVPVLVDGFICTAAALAAMRINPSVRPWLLFSHCSAERGHRTLIDALTVKPLLELDLRLGEGSGAALALPLLRMACALHNEMASFEAAGVSTP